MANWSDISFLIADLPLRNVRFNLKLKYNFRLVGFTLFTGHEGP
jgi:hypothetical protein